MELRPLVIALSLFISAYATAQNAVVCGKVVDEDNNPIPGAGIFINDRPQAITTLNGTFSCSVLQGENTSIRISYQSYIPVTIKRNLSAGETVFLSVKLKPKEPGGVIVKAVSNCDTCIVSIDINSI